MKVYSNRTSAKNANEWWWQVNLKDKELPVELPVFPY
jgi:hypothetical protein